MLWLAATEPLELGREKEAARMRVKVGSYSSGVTIVEVLATGFAPVSST